jgi:hypothetical protein
MLHSVGVLDGLGWMRLVLLLRVVQSWWWLRRWDGPCRGHPGCEVEEAKKISIEKGIESVNHVGIRKDTQANETWCALLIADMCVETLCLGGGPTGGANFQQAQQPHYTLAHGLEMAVEKPSHSVGS